MADASLLQPQFYITLGGEPASPDFMRDLEQVRIENSLHLADCATLVLHDPRLRWIDDKQVVSPGKTVVVSAKVGRNERSVFDGEIVEIEPEFVGASQRLMVRAFDRLHRLMRGRKVRSFQQISDGELIEKIAQEVGLQAEVGPTRQVHPYIFQANQTNLEFLQLRAAALGYVLYVQGKTLYCDVPKPGGQPIELTWGETLTEFRPRMSTINQVNRVVARGWDPLTRQELMREVERGRGTPAIGETRDGGEVAKDAFHIDAQDLVTGPLLRTQALTEQLAQARADQSAQHFVQADGICLGNPAIIAGATVRLNSVGSRFSGTYYVTSTLHIYNLNQSYTTHFSVSGVHPATLLSKLLPDTERLPVSGLVVGIVTDNQDPEGLGRIKVRYPWLSNDASDWARLAVVGGGADRGFEFLPEINDEVLVGFEFGDIHQPFILGGLWNGIDRPPEKSSDVVKDGSVQRRIIRSRTGHVIAFDDDKGSITIQDKDQNKITFNNGITVEDKNGNKVALDSNTNSLTIEVAGDATFKTTGNMLLEAQGQVTVKGLIISLNP